jgi:hypothetical protein
MIDGLAPLDAVVARLANGSRSAPGGARIGGVLRRALTGRGAIVMYETAVADGWKGETS